MKGLAGRTVSAFFALLLAGFCLLVAMLPSCAASAQERVSSAVVQSQSADKQRASRVLAEQRQSLPDNMVPYAAFLEDSANQPPRHVWGSWSLGNTLISFACLLEALIAIGSFSWRNRFGTAGLLTGSFMLRTLALFIALVALVATSITSDFTKAAIAFDKMSIPIMVLFVALQMILFAARERKSVMTTKESSSVGDCAEKHFRAKRRYGD
jgi:hypothetical protein